MSLRLRELLSNQPMRQNNINDHLFRIFKKSRTQKEKLVLLIRDPFQKMPGQLILEQELGQYGVLLDKKMTGQQRYMLYKIEMEQFQQLMSKKLTSEIVQKLKHLRIQLQGLFIKHRLFLQHQMNLFLTKRFILYLQQIKLSIFKALSNQLPNKTIS